MSTTLLLRRDSWVARHGKFQSHEYRWRCWHHNRRRSLNQVPKSVPSSEGFSDHFPHNNTSKGYLHQLLSVLYCIRIWVGFWEGFLGGFLQVDWIMTQLYLNLGRPFRRLFGSSFGTLSEIHRIGAQDCLSLLEQCEHSSFPDARYQSPDRSAENPAATTAGLPPCLASFLLPSFLPASSSHPKAFGFGLLCCKHKLPRHAHITGKHPNSNSKAPFDANRGNTSAQHAWTLQSMSRMIWNLSQSYFAVI